MLSFMAYCFLASQLHRGHNENSLPSESSENIVLDEIQYGESNGGNRFSIGRSMTKLCIKK